jgi:hypothetical protein
MFTYILYIIVTDVKVPAIDRSYFRTRRVTMDTDHFPHLSAYDSDPCIEEILVWCDPYIRIYALKYVPRNVCHDDTIDLDVDEIAQITRIKLWHMLQSQTIANFQAYAKRISFNEGVNMVRGSHGCLSLQMNEDGELIQGDLIGRKEQKNNPETLLEEQEGTDEMITIVADTIAGMRTCQRQQQAAICHLKEKWDDFPRLAAALKNRNVDIEVKYPENSYERQKLQSSYSPAKRKLAEKLGVDLALYK